MFVFELKRYGRSAGVVSDDRGTKDGGAGGNSRGHWTAVCGGASLCPRVYYEGCIDG